MCRCCDIYQIAVHATVLYGCTVVPPVNKVKPWNQQHVSFCSFTIKETNVVLILVVHSLQFSEVAAATTNMTDLSPHEYDWRLWLSHINMTDSGLTKYDWRRQLGDGGSGDKMGGWVAGWVGVCHSRYCIKTTKSILKLFDHLVAPSFS